MLVLIVVSAALALGAFVQTEEKANLAYRAQEQDRARESDNATSLLVTPSGPGSSTIGSLNITIANLGTSSSSITSISVNNIPLQGFISEYLSGGSAVPVCHQGNRTVPACGTASIPAVPMLANLTLLTGQEVDLQINTNWSFVYPDVTTLFSTQYVQVDVFTTLNNEFIKTFVPPEAFGVVASVDYYDSATMTTQAEIVYDGSDSKALNDTVIGWSWTTYTNPGMVPVPGSTVSGEEVPVPTNVTCSASGTLYTVGLTVTDTAGLSDTLDFPFDYVC